MNWFSYYLFWMIASVFLTAVFRYPPILVLVIIAFVARRWLPDPYLYFKSASRASQLRKDLKVNPYNASAARELALIYLSRRRPTRAIRFIEQARQRDEQSAELLYLLGLARVQAGAYEDALAPLMEAVKREPRLAYGDPYLQSGKAYVNLGRWDDAEAAFGRIAAINTSSIEARTRLGLVRTARGDKDGARRAFGDAKDTYRVLPGFQRRKQWWWALRAWCGM